MLSSLLLAWAWAECPDPTPLIRNAEEDAVSYFLADAESALAEAAGSFSCTQPSPTVVARFFLVRAMIWKLQEDPRSEEALHRAKQLDGAYFTASLGDEMKKAWEAVQVESIAPTIAVNLRGAKKNDTLWIDGTSLDAEGAATTPGIHLIQVQRNGSVVYGRIVDAPAGGPLELDLSAGSPSTGGYAGSFQAHFRGPILAKGLRDADGNRLSMVRDVVSVASLTPEGRELAARRRRNTVQQVIALSAVTLGPYLAYQGLWDNTIGKNNEPGFNNGLLLSGIGLTAGGLTWEIVLKVKRHRIKQQLIEQADQVLAP